jgi:hypothetical protein
MMTSKVRVRTQDQHDFKPWKYVQAVIKAHHAYPTKSYGAQFQLLAADTQLREPCRLRVVTARPVQGEMDLVVHSSVCANVTGTGKC